MRPGGERHRGLQNELQGLFAKAKIPSSPALASRIIALMDDPESSAADFGAAIRTDPALSARLLKTANSVHFAQRTPVTTTERAVTVLGLNRVKTISLGFQLVGHLQRLGGAPFDMKAFWQHSLLRACLARSVARTVVPQRKEEAFLVGLLQDCGILLLVQVLGCGYASLARSNLSPSAFFAVERESFPHTHVEAISVMASEWKLPEIIAVPLGRHHRRIKLAEEPSEMERLSAVSYFVGGLCFVGDLTVTAEEGSLREFGAKFLGLDDAAWPKAQKRAADEYQRVSTLYGDVLPEEVDATELLGEANRQLASVARDADQRVLNVEAERNGIRREQQRLQNALRDYRERAALDPLTNVLNRGALTEAARQAIERNLDDGHCIGMLFIDLDDFKKLNDTHGHQAGDTVLKIVAALLGQEAGHSGTVGRYGGEEFVMILQGLSADATRELAERVVRQIRNLDSHVLGFPGKVTCSMGGIWGDCVPGNSAEALFAAADRLMYQAKRRGKDCGCFESLPKPRHAGQREHPPPSDETACAVARRPGDAEAGGARLEKLLAAARRLNANKAATFVGIRKQERKKIVLPCVVHHFTGTGTKMGVVRAATRNISTGGIGLLVDRPMARGEAVEVVLDRHASKHFFAGLVSFCRRIDGTMHEVGVQFVLHSVTSIISEDPSEALRTYDWVAQALSAKQNGGLEPQVCS